MPLPWPAHAIARTAGTFVVTALIGSALTTAISSRLLISSEALAAVDETTIDLRPSASSTDAAAERREELLATALEQQAEAEDARGTALIVSNNIFCPECQPTPAAEQGATPSKPALSPTDLPLALLATMEAEQPQLSMATILDTERRATGVFAIGEEIRPGVVLAGVRRSKVILHNSQQLETLGFPEPGKPAKAKKRKAKAKKRKRGSREIPGAREAIACDGNACTVDRKFVEKLMANPRLLARQAKFVPAVKDGETRGFRVHRVRTGTLPRLLGLRNGDTLLAVNGTELDSMDRAIDLYTKLRRASELSLTVERKGKVFEKQISIR